MCWLLSAKYQWIITLVCLILPVITRWTGQYLSLTCLIKVEITLRTCVTQHKPALLLVLELMMQMPQVVATAVLMATFNNWYHFRA
jgi:hypothetical protein